MKKSLLTTASALALLSSVSQTRAACIGSPVQTNQSCTNDPATTLRDTSTNAGNNVGLQVLGPLTLTNFGNIVGTGITGVGVLGLTANVTNSGTISGGSFGVQGVTVDVTNSGGISGGNYGIDTNDAQVTNTGAILGGMVSILTFTANITNSGTISSGVEGINANNSAHIINSGTISGVFGILVGALGPLSASTIVNSGTIAGDIGILVGPSSTGTIVNAGTIIGTTNGIQTTGNATITNMQGGTVSGGSGVGIKATGPVNIVNAGSISGGVAAIQFTVDGNTLTLKSGSNIKGTVDFGATNANTVNLQGGNQQIKLNPAAIKPAFFSIVPFALINNQIVTLDPKGSGTTEFAARAVFNDFTRDVSEAVPVLDDGPALPPGPPSSNAFAPESGLGERFNEAFAAIPGLSAYASDGVVFKSPTAVAADGRAVWARGFAGARFQQTEGDLIASTGQFYGGMIGADFLAQANMRFGGFVGGGATRTDIALNTGASKADLVFGGLYGRYNFGVAFLEGAVQAGGSHNKATRNINGGDETATASFNGWYVSPELTLGYRYSVWPSYTLTPSIKVRYLANFFDGYTESGVDFPLTVDNRTAQSLEERGELKLTHTELLSRSSVLLVNISGGAIGIQSMGSNTVSASFVGQEIPFAVPGKTDTIGGFGGFGVEWRERNVSVYAATEAIGFSDHATVISGRGGVRVAF